MKINIVIVRDVYIFLNIKEFAAKFTEMKINLIMNFYLKYN